MKYKDGITLSRKTKETEIELYLNLFASGEINIQTGIGFLDHMLTSLAFHSEWTMNLTAKGDLHIDDHHTIEDCAIAIGQAINKQLEERKGITRYGYAYAPLDDSLSRSVVDLVSRPFSVINLPLKREKVGELSCENVSHFFQTLSAYSKFTLHIDLLRSTNDHHAIESAFKSLALALKSALLPSSEENPLSTKGVL